MINLTMVNLMRPSQHAATDDPVTMILLIGLSTAALAAVHRIVGVVMTSKLWAMLFIITTLRLGSCVACLIKVLTGMIISFLSEFLCATVTDMPSDIKWAARCVRTKRMRIASRLLPRGRRNGRRQRLPISTRA